MPGMWLPQQRAAEWPPARDGPAFGTRDVVPRGVPAGDWPAVAILDGEAVIATPPGLAERLGSRYAAASCGWMSRGACQGEDPELFFPIAVEGPALHQASEAKEVCRRCAVCAMCLAYAVETRQAGIWGGTTWEERRAMMRPSRLPLNGVLSK
jgi:WhiB family transcriptional regulator, redox-sensing transcriptional regulator